MLRVTLNTHAWLGELMHLFGWGLMLDVMSLPHHHHNDMRMVDERVDSNLIDDELFLESHTVKES